MKNRYLSLVLLVITSGCASVSGVPENVAPQIVTAHGSAEDLRHASQVIVDSFATQIVQIRSDWSFTPPKVEVRNTPALIFFAAGSNTVVVPVWETQPAEMQAVFRRFAGGTDAEAEELFHVFFNGFLIAHEAAHWFQLHANRNEPTLYMNENQANRIAVAFWRTQPGGDNFLAHLEILAARAASALPDPTPPGEDAVAFFQANYEALGQQPLSYGYYQFRFMNDALRDRYKLDFKSMVR